MPAGYILNKRKRFCIKMFSLCKDSGYLWNSFAYVGENGEPNPEEKCLNGELAYLELLLFR